MISESLNAPDTYIPVLNEDILVEEVETALQNLKTKKAPGEDGIPPGVFKVLDGALIEFLTELFNTIMRSGVYPRCWSTGIICPVHKAGPKHDPNNYRGITL